MSNWKSMSIREKKADILKKFGYKLLGSKTAQRYILKTLLIFPKKIIDYITSKVWFLSSFDDAWAFTFNAEDLKREHLIFLSDDLFVENDSQIMYTIAHEIGHVMLGHKNSYRNKDFKPSHGRLQERQADKFAKYYLNEAFNNT